MGFAKEKASSDTKMGQFTKEPLRKAFLTVGWVNKATAR